MANPIMRWGSVKTSESPGDGTEESTVQYFLKTYRVFNQAQIEGIAFPALEESSRAQRGKRLERAETVFERMRQKPKLRESRRNRAAYSLKKDEIEIPPFARFDSPAEYYLTLFHELVHATGHPDRLKRKGVVECDGKGGKVYSQEKLTAEIGAAFLAAETDTVTDDHIQSAAYVAEWLAALKEPDNRRWGLIAANQAGRAAEFILGVREADDQSGGDAEQEEPSLG